MSHSRVCEQSIVRFAQPSNDNNSNIEGGRHPPCLLSSRTSCQEDASPSFSNCVQGAVTWDASAGAALSVIFSISEDYHMGHLKLDDFIKFNEHSAGPKLLSYVTTFSRVLLARKEAEAR